MTAGLRSDDEAGSAAPGQPGYRNHLPAGAQRLGPYRLIQPLGEGGMGVVHLALDQSGRAVAIKVLREHIAGDHEARRRLRREVETLALVQDARVAAVLDADTEGPRPYIVTRYVPGPSLDTVVSENGPLHGEALLRLGRGLWDALNAIHGAGVIHRDLKPANVLLLDGDPVVIDFGIAHVADDIRLTMTGLVMGTPGYLSPEVVEGSPVTEAADWWGWAATLAFAASGAPPFGRGPMGVVLDRVRRGQPDLSGVDPWLAPLLAAALSPVPTSRPQAHEVVRALDRYASGVPSTLAIPVTDLPRSGPPEHDWLQEWQRHRQHESGVQPDPWAHRDPEVQEDPELHRDPWVGARSRRGAMVALLAGVLGVASVWPMVAFGLVALWCLLARFADRCVTSLVMRRHDHGPRRSDVPLAIMVSPWHVVVSVAATVIALVIPAIVATGATFSIALAAAALTGGDPAPGSSIPVVAGGFLGLLLCWWGPGGAHLQRGSRSLLGAGASRGPHQLVVGATDFFVAVFVLVGLGLGAWAWVRHIQPDWWPWSLAHVQALSGLHW